MQTFLPFPSFARSAAVLDDRRLGKQRVETLQILRALHLEDYGWRRHPAVLMWRGCTRALVAYGLAVIDEWSGRGHGDTTRPAISEFARPQAAVPEAALPAEQRPPWLGWPPLHRSHQAALVRKDPGLYAAAFPDTPPDLPYVWPDPPAGAPPLPPRSAWVLRATTPQAWALLADEGMVGLPAAFGGPQATPKQRRQGQRWLADARCGDRVAVLVDDERLRCGVLAGPPLEVEVAGARYVARDVTWDRTVRRAALVRPWQLQDPQTMFALRGEPAIAG